jgi:hypothetical protein
MRRALLFVGFCMSAVSLGASQGEIVFELSGFTFNATTGLSFFQGARVDALTGIGTPLRTGVTMFPHGNGIWMNAGLAGEDSSNWYLNNDYVVNEGIYSFSNHPMFLQPGDIAYGAYRPNWASPSFAIAKTNGPLSYTFGAFSGIDPRLAAFFGMAPPCLVAPDSIASQCLANNSEWFHSWYAVVKGVGTPLDANGISEFTATITVSRVPEPSTIVLLLTFLCFVSFIARRERGCA